MFGLGRSEEEPSPQERLTGTGGVTTTPAGGGPERTGPREGLILLLFALITIAASAFILWSEEQDAKNDPKLQAARGEVRGLDELSMLREKNLQRVLDKVSESKWPLISNIRIAPTNVVIQAADKDGFQRHMTFNTAFDMESTESTVSEIRTIPASKIDASAPERALRGVAERSGLDADAVDYVTNAYIIDQDSDWYIAMKEGPARVRQWVAEPDGRDVRHPGELSREEEQAQADQQREQERYQRIIRRRGECFSRASTAEQFARCNERFQP